MFAKVWHAKNPTFGLTEQNFPDDYELVAEVNTDNLEIVFRQTNHIDYPWWENDDVKVIKKSRSTSVGDVVEINGKFWLCETIGFSKLYPRVNHDTTNT